MNATYKIIVSLLLALALESCATNRVDTNNPSIVAVPWGAYKVEIISIDGVAPTPNKKIEVPAGRSVRIVFRCAGGVLSGQDQTIVYPLDASLPHNMWCNAGHGQISIGTPPSE